MDTLVPFFCRHLDGFPVILCYCSSTGRRKTRHSSAELQELCLDQCGIGNAGATVLGLALGGGAVKKSNVAGDLGKHAAPQYFQSTLSGCNILLYAPSALRFNHSVTTPIIEFKTVCVVEPPVAQVEWITLKSVGAGDCGFDLRYTVMWVQFFFFLSDILLSVLENVRTRRTKNVHQARKPTS